MKYSHLISATTISQGVSHLVTYKKLWRLLNQRGYATHDIVSLVGISESTYQKLIKDEHVRMDILERICMALNVDVGDICSFRTFLN